ncbi:hypothetical protein F5Y01DRAFT_66809 [Xylaria sp. FL0043]|nr:hypothetical protein F5Y01DRAFT_66809 [Xylaria sp. FL0043]
MQRMRPSPLVTLMLLDAALPCATNHITPIMTRYEIWTALDRSAFLFLLLHAQPALGGNSGWETAQDSKLLHSLMHMRDIIVPPKVHPFALLHTIEGKNHSKIMCELCSLCYMNVFAWLMYVRKLSY